MKRFLILSAVLTVSVTASDWKHKLYRASQFVNIGMSTADVMSSIGKYESNPMLRSANGQFGARGMLTKTAIIGGMLALQRIGERKLGPSTYLPFAAVNLVYSGVAYKVVRHNMNVRKVGQ